MSTIDIVEETSIFPTFVSASKNNQTITEYEPQEIVWLLVLTGSIACFLYTFLKRKP